MALSSTQPVTLWGRTLPNGREVARLPGVTLPDAVMLTDDLDAALAGQDRAILALPAQALRGFLADHGDRLDGRWLINTAKGIDLATGESPSALITRRSTLTSSSGRSTNRRKTPGTSAIRRALIAW